MRFEAPKGQRILYNFFGVEVEGHMYYPNEKVWLPFDEHPEGEWEYACSDMDCKTFRAFKRFLRKNPQFKGKCRLVSRYVNHNIYA